MVDRFIARFGDCIAVLHSKLSVGERYDEWNRIYNNEAKIVIGARSAIFAPVEDLGIIIIDEEHDISYKADSTPRYNAKELASYIAKLNNCPIVLGSATPDLCTYYKTTEDQIRRYELAKRANEASLPEVKIVDLRQELAIGNRSMLSLELRAEIEENIKNKKQTILFLNRRGYSTFVMCRECGYTAKCNNCNISLTYHKNENKLKCHYCGYEIRTLEKCPECNSNKIKYFGTGTQKLEEEVKNIFSGVSTIRMDIDTVTKKNAHEDILNKFKNENIDILIGTQMVVKGHHFPNVTLVGVIVADSSLNLEDYRAVERTFQTLVQVSGRAGREKEKGKVIIQTYNPDNYAIEYSKTQDYLRFYESELQLRKMLNYPPFCDIILIRLTGKNEEKLKKVSDKIYNNLKKNINDQNYNIFKPVPAPVDKIKNNYRWRIILKGKLNSRLLENISKSIYNEKNEDITIVVDVNPNNMM